MHRCFPRRPPDFASASWKRLLHRDLAPARRHQRAGEGRRERPDAEAREQRMPEHVAMGSRRGCWPAPRRSAADRESAKMNFRRRSSRRGRAPRPADAARDAARAQCAGQAKMHDMNHPASVSNSVILPRARSPDFSTAAHHMTAQNFRDPRRNRPMRSAGVWTLPTRSTCGRTHTVRFLVG